MLPEDKTNLALHSSRTSGTTKREQYMLPNGNTLTIVTKPNAVRTEPSQRVYVNQKYMTNKNAADMLRRINDLPTELPHEKEALPHLVQAIVLEHQLRRTKSTTTAASMQYEIKRNRERAAKIIEGHQRKAETAEPQPATAPAPAEQKAEQKAEQPELPATVSIPADGAARLSKHLDILLDCLTGKRPHGPETIMAGIEVTQFSNWLKQQ